MSIKMFLLIVLLRAYMNVCRPTVRFCDEFELNSKSNHSTLDLGQNESYPSIPVYMIK